MDVQCIKEVIILAQAVEKSPEPLWQDNVRQIVMKLAAEQRNFGGQKLVVEMKSVTIHSHQQLLKDHCVHPSIPRNKMI